MAPAVNDSYNTLFNYLSCTK